MNKRSVDPKTSIIAAARRVFTENGYAEASMRLIAQTAGMSVGCLYLHFKNKEDLFITLTQQWMNELDACTRDSLAGIEDPAEALRVFISVTVEFSAGHREMIMLQGREVSFAPGRELKQDFFRRRRILLRELIDRGIESGIFVQCDAGEAAKVVFNLLRGYVFSMLIDEEALFSPEQCSNILLKGLLRRHGG